MAKFTDTEIQERLEKNKTIYFEHFDVEFCRALTEHVLSIHIDTYFRVKKVGFEEPIERNNPDAPVIIISNHSGMAFPWDAIIFLSQTFRENDYDHNQVPRPLVAPLLSQTLLTNPFMIPHFWKKCGGVDASFLNFETMMEYPDSNVMIYPEGVPGIGKGFNNKYQLQRFATSFARMALKHQTDIVPYVTINGEWVNPYCYSFDWINKIVKKIGLAFFPIGIHTPLLFFLPWMFYYAMPANLTYVKCRRIRTRDHIDKLPEDITEEDVKRFRDIVHASMQEDLDKHEKEYGKRVYDRPTLYRKIRENFKHFPFMFPIAWPIIFAEFERQWNRYKKNGTPIQLKYGLTGLIIMLILNPIVICYYIPILGWIPLLIKGYRNNTLGKN